MCSNRWETALAAKKKKDQEAAQALQNRKSLPPIKGTRSSSFTMNPEGSSATSLRIEEDGPIIPPGFSAKPVSQTSSQTSGNPGKKEIASAEKIVIIDSNIDTYGGRTT